MKYSTHGWRAPSWMWLTRCVSGNSLWRPPPLGLALHEAPRPVCSKPRPPSHQIREAAWGTGTSYVRVPWGNDTEYKCTGRASDGPAHVEVFALQKRVVSGARWGSPWQSDRGRWRLLSPAFRTLDTAELAPASSSTSTHSTFPHVRILEAYLWKRCFSLISDLDFTWHFILSGCVLCPWRRP